MPAVIVVCGPTGSGKSTLRKALVARGARGVDADEVARSVVEPGSEVLAALVANFGEDIVDADGRLRRDVLAARAFASAEGTALLDALTHPAIRRAIEARVSEANAAEVVVVEVPLWRRGDAWLDPDLVVWVGASTERAGARVAKEGRMTETELRRRRARFDYEAQRREADLVVDNDGSPEALAEAADHVWSLAVAALGKGCEGS